MAITPANPMVNTTDTNLVEKTFASIVMILQKRARFRVVQCCSGLIFWVECRKRKGTMCFVRRIMILM